MIVNVYFNNEFVTSNDYCKVSVVIEKDGKFHLFASTYNKNTHKVEVQRFVDITTKKVVFLAMGNKKNCKIKHLAEIKETSEFKEFIHCINKLHHAEKRFFQLASNYFTEDEINYINKLITGIETVANSNDTNSISTETKVEETLKEEDSTIAKNAREYIRMAKITNAENLADIINGNFYPIIDTKNINGKNYFIIDVNGNLKAVSSNRIKEINVYTESPV
jgi:SepF-like predicted cell division protein (DUF552 family)